MIKFKVKKLHQGDYSLEGHENNIIIERKANLLELCGNFCQGRKRFEREFIRAKEAGAKIYLLIEDSQGREKMLLRRTYDKYIQKVNNEWVWVENDMFPGMTLKKALNKTWSSYYTANSMIASLTSWKEKYNLNIEFCDKKESGAKIIEIFEEYLKEVGE